MLRKLAFAAALTERRKAGARVGLLVVSLHDWKSGVWFEGREEVVRLVLPPDVSVGSADWSVAMALDVLLCGSAPDEVFYEVCSAIERVGAASIWGDFDSGLWLLERCRATWVATDGPYEPKALPQRLRSHRTVMMMLRRGFYGSRVFDQARQAILASMRGAAA